MTSLDLLFLVLSWLGTNFLAVALLLLLSTPIVVALSFAFVTWKLGGKRR